jgi:hypothetical protein
MKRAGAPRGPGLSWPATFCAGGPPSCCGSLPQRSWFLRPGARPDTPRALGVRLAYRRRTVWSGAARWSTCALGRLGSLRRRSLRGRSKLPRARRAPTALWVPARALTRLARLGFRRPKWRVSNPMTRISAANQELGFRRHSRPGLKSDINVFYTSDFMLPGRPGVRGSPPSSPVRSYDRWVLPLGIPFFGGVASEKGSRGRTKAGRGGDCDDSAAAP